MQSYFDPNQKKKKFNLSFLKFFKFKKRTKDENSTGFVAENTKKFKFPWKTTLKVLAVILVIKIIVLSVLFFVYGRPAYAIYQSAIKLKTNAGTLQDSLKTQDLDKINTSLKAFKTDFEDFKVTYEKNIGLFKNFPFVSTYVSDAEHLIKAGDYGIELGFIVIETLDPYAAELGLKEGSSKLTNEERIKQIAIVLPQFSKEVDKIAGLFSQIDNELDYIDETKYPQEFRGIAVREQISSIKTVFSQLALKSPKFKGLFEQLPYLLGVQKPITYLVLMANSTEIRMGGGFTTYAVVVQLENGVPKIVKSVDTYSIDVDDSNLVYKVYAGNPYYFLREYLKVTRIYARDSLSISPDFVTGVDFFMGNFWNIHNGRGQAGYLPKVDAVVSVNTHLAEDLLAVLGSVDVAGRSFKTDTGAFKGFRDTEFNSENVIYNLEYIANAELSEIKGRKDIIQFLLESILDKILNARTENLASLSRVFLNALASKDLMVYSFEEEPQKALEDLGYAGRVNAPVDNTSDYMFIVHSNFGAGKRDWIVTRETNRELLVENGKNIVKLDITVNNPKAPDWWQPSWLYTYKDYLRVYVPKNSKIVSVTASDNQDVDPRTVTDAADTPKLDYFSFFFRIEEGNTLTLSIKYELPSEVDVNNYKLYLQKQSGIHNDVYTIKKGDEVKKFTITEDTLLQF